MLARGERHCETYDNWMNDARAAHVPLSYAKERVSSIGSSEILTQNKSSPWGSPKTATRGAKVRGRQGEVDQRW
jgi:hypothetical protein